MQSPEDLPLSDATAPPLTVASRAVPISTEPPAMVGESRREGIRRLRPATPDRRTCSKPSSCKTELRIYPPYLPEAGRDGKCPMLIERLQAVEDLACKHNRPTSLAVMGMDRLDYSNCGLRDPALLSGKARDFIRYLERETGVPV